MSLEWHVDNMSHARSDAINRVHLPRIMLICGEMSEQNLQAKRPLVSLSDSARHFEFLSATRHQMSDLLVECGHIYSEFVSRCQWLLHPQQTHTQLGQGNSHIQRSSCTQHACVVGKCIKCAGVQCRNVIISTIFTVQYNTVTHVVW